MTDLNQMLDKFKETAPLGTRDISIRLEETRLGAVLSFKPNHEDIDISIPIDYESLCNKKFDYEKFWTRVTEESKEKNYFRKARDRFCEYQDLLSWLDTVNVLTYYGMRERPELFNHLNAFILAKTTDGDFKVGPYVISGPETRYAMDKAKDDNLTVNVLGSTYKSGDPELLRNLWKEYTPDATN